MTAVWKAALKIAIIAILFGAVWYVAPQRMDGRLVWTFYLFLALRMIHLEERIDDLQRRTGEAKLWAMDASRKAQEKRDRT